MPSLSTPYKAANPPPLRSLYSSSGFADELNEPSESEPRDLWLRLGRGLPTQAVINRDNLNTIPMAILDPEPVGRLDAASRASLDRALRYALDIIY